MCIRDRRRAGDRMRTAPAQTLALLGIRQLRPQDVYKRQTPRCATDARRCACLPTSSIGSRSSRCTACPSRDSPTTTCFVLPCSQASSTGTAFPEATRSPEPSGASPARNPLPHYYSPWRISPTDLRQPRVPIASRPDCRPKNAPRFLKMCIIDSSRACPGWTAR